MQSNKDALHEGGHPRQSAGQGGSGGRGQSAFPRREITDEREQARKDKNKAFVGNHNRKGFIPELSFLIYI